MKAVIDAHAHFIPRGAVRAAKTGEIWHGLRIEVAENSAVAVTRPPANPKSDAERVFRRIPAYFQTPDQRLVNMKAAGIDMQIVSMSPALFRYDLDSVAAVAFAREINDDLHALSTEWPDHFAGFGSLPMQDVDASVAELERCVRDLGLLGVIVDTHVNGADWDSPTLFPVLEAAEALGAVVFIHPGMQRVAKLWPRYHFRNLIGNPLETTVAVASLIFGGVLDRLPQSKMFFAHAGGFACANVGRFDHGHEVRQETKGGAAKFPSDYLKHLYFDTITHNETALRNVIDVAGISQVVLGTDFPADMGEDRPVEWVMSCDTLAAEEKDAILRRNAFPFLKTKSKTLGGDHGRERKQAG
jgi:aminocarboxymuconate-semialdehyde decarboxylase